MDGRKMIWEEYFVLLPHHALGTLPPERSWRDVLGNTVRAGHACGTRRVKTSFQAKEACAIKQAPTRRLRLQDDPWYDTSGEATLSKQSATAALRELEAGLSSSNAKWKIVVGHHPVYSFSDHGCVCGPATQRTRSHTCAYLLQGGHWVFGLTDPAR